MAKTSYKETSEDIMNKADSMPPVETEGLSEDKGMTISVSTDGENETPPMTLEEFKEKCAAVRDMTNGIAASMNVGVNSQVMRDQQRKETEEEYELRKQNALYSSITAYEMLDVQRRQIMDEMNDLVGNLEEQYDLKKKFVKQAIKDRREGLQMRFFDREETDKIHNMMEAQAKVEKLKVN